MRCDLAPYGASFNPAFYGAVKSRCIDRVKVAAKAQPVHIIALDEIDHDGAMSSLGHVAQFLQMLGAACGDAVGEFGQPRDAAEMHVLDLDIGEASCWIAKQEVPMRELTPYFCSARSSA